MGHSSAGCYSKQSSLGATPPALPSPSWLPLSLGASQAPFGSGRCGDTGFFGKFPSRSPFKHKSDSASDTTEDRPETAASGVDRAQFLNPK